MPSSTVTVPKSLRWIAGGGGCRVRLEIANVTNQNNQPGRSITISGLDLHLATSPILNTYPYTDPVLDVCTVTTSAVICGSPSSGPDDVYVGSATLGDGTIFPAQLQVGEGAIAKDYPDPPFLLSPGDTRDIDLGIAEAQGTPARIYQVVPELLVNDGSPRSLAYPELRSTLVFRQSAINALSSCYGITQVGGIDQILPVSQITYDPGAHAYCP
jgi:hypothetical protein